MPPRGTTRLAQGAARAPATVPASTPNRAASPAAADEDDGGLDDSDVNDPVERIIKAFTTVHAEVRTKTKAEKLSLTLSQGMYCCVYKNNAGRQSHATLSQFGSR
jgi:hypothetical protein